jgi:hypothetical protein
VLPFDQPRLDALAGACELHADGQVAEDPVVGCCWDADRLDLWRVGSAVDPDLLSTEAARRPERIGGARALARAPFAWDALLRLATNAAPERAFWVEAGRLLAGVYAGASAGALAAAGVTLFGGLTEDGELDAYAPGPARHARFGVPDMTVAPAEVLEAALDAIDQEVARGGLVYVHCWGGCGRTGTLVACWLVRHGVDPQVALDRYAAISRAAAGRPCPETEEQREAVLAWRARP